MKLVKVKDDKNKVKEVDPKVAEVLILRYGWKKVTTK